MSESGGSGRTILLNWGPTLLFNVALPIATYLLLTDHGVHGVLALTLSGLWPAADLAVVYALRRRLDDFSMLTLLFLLLSIGASAVFHSERMLLIKESAITGVFGLICLASLAARRPLMFYFGRKFATDGTPESLAHWNGLWQYEGFRQTQRLITTVWGVVYIVEAAVRIALTFLVSHDASVTLNSVVPYVVLGALLFWTIRLGKARRAASVATSRPAEPAPDSAEPAIRAR